VFVVPDELRVVDDRGQEVPADGATMGEVVMRGNTVMQGYFRQPDRTAQALDGAKLQFKVSGKTVQGTFSDLQKLAGQGARIHLQAFADGDDRVAVGVFASDGAPPDRPHCTIQARFTP